MDQVTTNIRPVCKRRQDSSWTTKANTRDQEWSSPLGPSSSLLHFFQSATSEPRPFPWPKLMKRSQICKAWARAWRRTLWDLHQATPGSSWWLTPICWGPWCLWTKECLISVSLRTFSAQSAEMSIQTWARTSPSSEGTPWGAWWEECIGHAGRCRSSGTGIMQAAADNRFTFSNPLLLSENVNVYAIYLKIILQLNAEKIILQGLICSLFYFNIFSFLSFVSHLNMWFECDD